MTAEQLRLACLQLAVPKDIANPDITMVLAKADQYYRFVLDTGQASQPEQAIKAADTPRKRGRPRKIDGPPSP